MKNQKRKEDEKESQMNQLPETNSVFHQFCSNETASNQRFPEEEAILSVFRLLPFLCSMPILCKEPTIPSNNSSSMPSEGTIWGK